MGRTQSRKPTRGETSYLGRSAAVLPSCAHRQGSQEGSRKMRNRRRNWFIKRIALGFAVAAFAAPVAQAKVDEGSSIQANGYQAFVTDFPSSSSVDVSGY